MNHQEKETYDTFLVCQFKIKTAINFPLPFPFHFNFFVIITLYLTKLTPFSIKFLIV